MSLFINRPGKPKEEHTFKYMLHNAGHDAKEVKSIQEKRVNRIKESDKYAYNIVCSNSSIDNKRVARGYCVKSEVQNQSKKGNQSRV